LGSILPFFDRSPCHSGPSSLESFVSTLLIAELERSPPSCLPPFLTYPAVPPLQAGSPSRASPSLPFFPLVHGIQGPSFVGDIPSLQLPLFHHAVPFHLFPTFYFFPLLRALGTARFKSSLPLRARSTIASADPLCRLVNHFFRPSTRPSTQLHPPHRVSCLGELSSSELFRPYFSGAVFRFQPSPPFPPSSSEPLRLPIAQTSIADDPIATDHTYSAPN